VPPHEHDLRAVGRPVGLAVVAVHVRESPLIAAALCDRLSDGISMVYSFFNPDWAQRSLGTFMILEHVEYARSLGYPYVYLGYWIEGSRKMRYKERFQPQERLTSKGWVRGTDTDTFPR
jgi:arginine-tRNA-protein transferase